MDPLSSTGRGILFLAVCLSARFKELIKTNAKGIG